MKRPLYILVAVIIVILVVALVTQPEPEVQPPAPADDERQPLLASVERVVASPYYLSQDGQYLIPINLDIAATNEVAEVALELLLSGSPLDGLKDSVPADVKLLEIYTIYRTVYVNLSADFLAISEEDMPAAVQAICATVLWQTEDYKLQLLVEGEGRDYVSGVDLSEPLPWPALNVDLASLPEDMLQEEAARRRWYMPQEGSTLLVPRTMFYDAAADDQLLLIARRIVPTGLLVEDITIDNQRLLVSLSADAAAAYRASAAFEQSWVEALCRSLCFSTDYTEVQLSFGEQSALPKGLDISHPFSYSTPLNYIKL